jgi:phospholipid/cholesterol/gamma-HCH transport system substrate-binding protein
MSTRNTRAVTVGIFIFLGLAIFILGVLTLGGQRKTFASSIDIKAVFDDVNGLQKGNNVWLSGVKVGTITSVQFNQGGGVDVLLSIDEDAVPYIHKDATAKLGTDGLIGNKIIVLSGGSSKQPVIADGDVIGIQKTIAMDDLLTTLQANNKNILDITNDFKLVSQRVANGQGSLGKLLKEETLANQIEGAMLTLQRASRNAENLTSSMASYASRLQKPGSLTNDLVSDTVLFSRLRYSVGQIQEITVKANDVMNSLKSTSANLNADLSKSNTPAGVLLHDEETAVNLKAAIKNLQTSTEKLDENMEALQHNFLLRGFFKKREKEKQKEKAKQ